MTIRIAIAEDQRMLRELLSAVLAKEPGLVVVGEAATGPEALDMAQALQPDVLVLDIGLPETDGIEVARTLRKNQPTLKLLALSVHTEQRFIEEMLKAGADGYVVKSAALAEVVQAIRAVTQDKIYLSQNVTREAQTSKLAGLLAPRERQVLGLIAEGKRSVEIARRLHISPATVEAHRRNIMRKLDLHTVAELTRYAVREGIATL
jgi:two-component system NarL family response regulator